MNHHFSIRTRAAALGFAILAIGATTVGTAQATLVVPISPSTFGPTAGDLNVARLVTSTQADNVHAALKDINSQLSAGR